MNLAWQFSGTEPHRQIERQYVRCQQPVATGMRAGRTNRQRTGGDVVVSREV